MHKLFIAAIMLSTLSAPAFAHITFPFGHSTHVTRQADIRRDAVSDLSRNAGRDPKRDAQRDTARDFACDTAHDKNLLADLPSTRDQRDIDLDQRLQVYMYNGVR